MKLIKTFIIIVVVLFLVYFLTQNNARVYVNLVFTEFNDASVSMVIFGSLSIGIFLGYLFIEPTHIFVILGLNYCIKIFLYNLCMNIQIDQIITAI